MQLLRKDILAKCAKKHPDVREQISAFEVDIEKAEWETPQDIVGGRWLGKNSVVVFNIKGNEYRIVARVDFQRRLVLVRFAGTHADYSKIKDVTNI